MRRGGPFVVSFRRMCVFAMVVVESARKWQPYGAGARQKKCAMHNARPKMPDSVMANHVRWVAYSTSLGMEEARRAFVRPLYA